jgi:uncharacterized Zn-finger protein
MCGPQNCCSLPTHQKAHSCAHPSLSTLPNLTNMFQSNSLNPIQTNRNLSSLSISPTNTPAPSMISPNSRPLSQDKPYVCDYCGRGYSYLASLQQHLKTHQIEYQHQCTGCSRLFKTKQELDEHKKTHEADGSDTRPHQCDTCGKRFTLLENLHRHQMIHSDQRPFHCAFCGKRFRLAQHLKEHIRIHTGKSNLRRVTCQKRESIVDLIIEVHFLRFIGVVRGFDNR